MFVLGHTNSICFGSRQWPGLRGAGGRQVRAGSPAPPRAAVRAPEPCAEPAPAASQRPPEPWTEGPCRPAHDGSLQTVNEKVLSLPQMPSCSAMNAHGSADTCRQTREQARMSVSCDRDAVRTSPNEPDPSSHSLPSGRRQIWMSEGRIWRRNLTCAANVWPCVGSPGTAC